MSEPPLVCNTCGGRVTLSVKFTRKRIANFHAECTECDANGTLRPGFDYERDDYPTPEDD